MEDSTECSGDGMLGLVFNEMPESESLDSAVFSGCFGLKALHSDRSEPSAGPERSSESDWLIVAEEGMLLLILGSAMKAE
jgi:hypothetical protein